MGVPGPWYDRLLPHFRMGSHAELWGKNCKSEYFCAAAQCGGRDSGQWRGCAMRFRSLLLDHRDPGRLVEDDLWMSPCYRRPSVAIHFTWKPDWPAVRRVLAVIEKELGAFEARPHWGKLFTMRRPRYERLEEFRRLAAKYDPTGKFRNEFLRTNIFLGQHFTQRRRARKAKSWRAFAPLRERCF